MLPQPTSVRWTDHAVDKARQLGFLRHDVELALFERHHERRRNAGSAGWQIVTGRLAIVYEYPDGDDDFAARVVTVWRRR
jgi:hypothetical protein